VQVLIGVESLRDSSHCWNSQLFEARPAIFCTSAEAHCNFLCDRVKAELNCTAKSAVGTYRAKRFCVFAIEKDDVVYWYLIQ
jgi:hypothetical protein